MRFFRNHTSAATTAKAMPFGGLGFAMESVQAVAQVMTLVPHCREDNTGVTLPTPDFVSQPSGYSLLVTLGREIRGR
ncbi:MAG: hypothetical protein OCC46_11465 [Pseudodesulfovibrio sp.]